MTFSTPASELIRRRVSCRSYRITPLSGELTAQIQAAIAALPPAPFGSANRFVLIAADDEDRSALRGLGTYGFIRNPAAFLIGAGAEAPSSLEDFGYSMEWLVLQVTALGLGSCWLGGSFTRSSFAGKITAQKDEIIPAVVALGHPAETVGLMGRTIQQQVGARQRLGWDTLFFEGGFGTPLSRQQAGQYAEALEMVRLAPSASNKQPWRVVLAGDRLHFYRQRTPGYGDSWLNRLLGVADMQRVDLGIAMCHFELSAAEAGLPGRWRVEDPHLPLPNTLTEYVGTWMSVKRE